MPSKEIYNWLRAHKLIKWAALCKEVGIDKSNFKKAMDTDKDLSQDCENKIREVLKNYGFNNIASEVIKDVSSCGVAVTKMASKKMKRIDPINNEAQEIINKTPKTLDQLKAICPHPPNSDERRIWVATNRQKYSI